MDLFSDVWVLVFQQLINDHATLCNVSLVCCAWRTLSWPSLLTIVDLSSHNIEGRLTGHESSARPIVYSHHHAKYRPATLVPRQRKFLHLITAQPALANYVKSLTWTLVWRDSCRDSDRSPLLADDRETWNVFARLLSVTRLDLASIHDVWDDEITCANPAELFPKVTDLRLLGWMHRGLVKAILKAIDTTKLRSLRLDYLEDQGNFPCGHLMNGEIAVDFAKTAHRGSISDDEQVISDSLFQRQQTGKAAVFPGPMWLPLHILSTRPLVSLSHLQLIVPRFGMDTDVRCYYTTFREAGRLLRQVSSSLSSLVVIFGEDTRHFKPKTWVGTDRGYYLQFYRPWCVRMAAAFLKQLLIALSECSFPNLTRLTFEGFHQLESAQGGPDLGGTLPYIRNSRFNDVDFTGTSHMDARSPFEGFDCHVPDSWEEMLRDS